MPPKAEPLADLHRHLDGSLRPETIEELAGRAGVRVPADLMFRPGMGLAEALSKLAFTLSLVQGPEAVRRVASEMCEDAAADGVTTLEIRFAPQLHRGASVEGIVDAALEGAAELGLERTIHAGEGRPPREIRDAVELLGAQRIVTIEACPTSNVHTGAIGSVAEHPLPRWLDAGVRACICTDNTLLPAVTSAEEHRRAREIPGMTDGKLRQAIAWGHAGAFRRG